MQYRHVAFCTSSRVSLVLNCACSDMWLYKDSGLILLNFRMNKPQTHCGMCFANGTCKKKQIRQAHFPCPICIAHCLMQYQLVHQSILLRHKNVTRSDCEWPVSTHIYVKISNSIEFHYVYKHIFFSAHRLSLHLIVESLSFSRLRWPSIYAIHEI